MNYFPDIDTIRWIPLGAICDAYEKDRMTIINAYWNGHIHMVKVGKRWLVDWRDCVNRWGEPLHPVEITIE